MSRISKNEFKALLSNPDFERGLMGTVAGDYLGGDVDAGRFDEADFDELETAVRQTDAYTLARFVIACLERMYELSEG